MQRVQLSEFPQETGVLFDRNAQSLWSGVVDQKQRANAPPWPRSFASDGYASTLVVHLCLQLASLAVLIVAAVHVREEQKLHVIDVIAAIAATAWAVGVFSLLVVAIVANFPTDNVFATGLTVGGYVIGFAMTTCLLAFSVRSDDEFTPGVAWSIAALCCEAAAAGVYTGCVVNLAARGGRVFTQPGAKGKADSLLLNRQERAEANDFPA